MSETIEVNGKTYKRVPEEIKGMCTGCARKGETYEDCQPIIATCLDTGTILKEVKVPARKTDPATSHAAAKAVLPKRAGIKHHILITLATWSDSPMYPGGMTGKEIASRNQGLALNSITPRFAELSGKKYATRFGLPLRLVPPAERKIEDSGLRRDGQIVEAAALSAERTSSTKASPL